MSSVDDPEKHFLGNLLEDDPGSTGPGRTERAERYEAPTSAPPLSQLSNVGPVMCPISSVSMPNAWPEPPPPYSPRADSWEPPLSTTANTTLFGQTSPPNSWLFPKYEQELKETNGSDYLSTFNISGTSSPVSPSTPTRILSSSPQIHHFHHNLHHHTHTHNVQVQNHYFNSPPPGLERFAPRAPSTTTTSSSSEQVTSPVWNYAGLANINTNPSRVLFSDWKKENMSQTSPEPSTTSESPSSTGSSRRNDQELSPIHSPLSPSEVVEVAKEKKNVSRSYAEHLTKCNSVPLKKGAPIGAEKKQKQELAKKMSNQLIGESTRSRIQVEGQPHSAPVITRMPFSYRDVAARQDQSSPSNHSIHQQEEANNEKKVTASSKETKSSDTKSVQTKPHQTSSRDESQKKTDGRKSRADNEFQKINSRKNKKEKSTGGAAPAPVIYEGVHPVDASSRYDVLNTLESPTSGVAQQRNGKKNGNGRPPQIQEIFSRSGSPVDDMADTEEEETHRSRAASTHSHLNGNSQSKKDQKKQQRVVQVNQQRRRKGKKAEPTWIDNACGRAAELLCFLFGTIYHGIEWTMQLIVEVCQRTYDLSVTSSRCLIWGLWRGLCTVIIGLIYLCFLLIITVKRAVVGVLTFINLIGEETQLGELNWGPKREVPIPTNATEFADRLSRETIRDAYSVLGLRSDCSDDDIKRNYKRLASLVSPDKCTIDAVDEVFEVVNLAFSAIGLPESRSEYTLENAENNESHQNLVFAWKKMATAVETARNTVFCDCSQTHLRRATDIVPSQARYCKRCQSYHPAKQNDIWAEKKGFFFSSTYYTCTDNVVYDITDWATCESQRAMLKNLRAHTHNVQYRLLPPVTSEYESTYFNQPMSHQAPNDTRYDLSDDYSIFRQRNLAQISFKNCEPREEDRSRRAANRRQKRWR